MVFILSLYLSLISLLAAFASTYEYNTFNEFVRSNILINLKQILYFFSYGLLSLLIVIAINKPVQSIALLFMIPILENLIFAVLNKFNNASNICNYYLQNIGTNLNYSSADSDVITLALILFNYIVVFNISSIYL